MKVILRLDAGPFLLDISDDCSRWRAHLNLLKATWEAAGITPVGPAEMNDLPVCIILDDHVKWTQGTTDNSCTAFGVFLSFVNIL